MTSLDNNPDSSPVLRDATMVVVREMHVRRESIGKKLRYGGRFQRAY